MIWDNGLLLIILSMGMFFNNSLIAASAGSLLVLKLAKMQKVLYLLERHAMDLGLLFLLVAVLVPFSLDKVGVKDIWETFRTTRGWLSIIGGIIAAYMCGQGMLLLQLEPEIVAGLVIGTVIGVSLVKGIPVGPLAAAGVTALLLNLLGLTKK